MPEDDVYHCPECGFEWGGHNRSPPHPHCPECNYGMMREGPADEGNSNIDHRLKKEEELMEDYREVRRDLAAFWRNRPRNKALDAAFGDPVRTLKERVDWLEDVLQIPEEDRFEWEEHDPWH